MIYGNGEKSEAKLGYDVAVFTGVLNSMSDENRDYYTKGFENIYSLICKSSLDGLIFAADRFRNDRLVHRIFDYIAQTDIPVLTLEYKHGTIPYINAEQCGYKNENHFMRQFKEKNGMTALQYRKNSV